MPDRAFFVFATPEELLAAAHAVRGLGYAEVETYAPYDVPELDEKLAIRRTRIPIAVFLAAALGCLVAFGILWGTNAYDYAIDVGGRPLDSLPADIPIVFETTVLFGSLTAFVLVFLRSGMPRLHHPIMEVDGIESASVDRFWIGVAGGANDAVLRTRMTALGALAPEHSEGTS